MTLLVERKIGGVIALIYPDEGAMLETPGQFVDLIGETYGTGGEYLVVPVARIAPEFFELRSGLAGEVFQKFQNYRLRLVILGDVATHLARSSALRDFVRETNRIGYHLFVGDDADLVKRLAAQS